MSTPAKKHERLDKARICLSEVLKRRSLPVNAMHSARTLRALHALAPRERWLLVAVDLCGFDSVCDVERLADAFGVSAPSIVGTIAQARASFERASHR